MRQLKDLLHTIFIYLRTMVIVVLIWWAISAWVEKPYLIPGPITVFQESWKLLISGKVSEAIAISSQRLLIAYGMAGIIGIPLGVAIGLSRWVAALFDWVIELLRPISGIAWIPVLLIIFGISNMLPISIIFIASIFPFILNTASGVRNVDSKLVNAGKVLGASQLRIIRTIMLPAAVPDILTGARVAASNSWMAVIVAELIGAPDGLGYSIGFAQELGKASLVLAWVVYVGIFGYFLDLVLQVVQTGLTPWMKGLKVGEK